MKRGEKKAFLWIGISVAAIAAVTITLEVQHQDLQVISILKDAKKAVSMHKYGGATNIPVGINPDGLPDAKSRGATMLTLYCAQCHELPPPSMHTTTEWRQVIARMKEFMRLRGGGMLMRTITPPEEDWAILESYLDTHAQVPLDKKQTSDLDTPGGKSGQESCYA